MGELTCHHECKREPFLHRLSVNLVRQGGKTHIFFVLVLWERQITRNSWIYFLRFLIFVDLFTGSCVQPLHELTSGES